MNPDFLVDGVIWFVVFLFSDTCHEAAHALAAKWGGDLTAYHGGQVSLDPLPHIRREPFGMVVVPILSYIFSGWMMGWASAPYDPLWAQRHPRRAAWMAVAGPAADFVLAILAAILIRVGILAGIFEAPDSATFTHVVAAVHPGWASGVAMFLSLMFTLNILLGIFNLLPVPPLDGFGAIGLFLPEEQGARFQAFGQSLRGFSYMGILIAWKLFDPMFDPIFTGALRALYPGMGYGS